MSRKGCQSITNVKCKKWGKNRIGCDRQRRAAQFGQVTDLDHLLGGRGAQVSLRTHAAEGEGERETKQTDKNEGQKQFDT